MSKKTEAKAAAVTEVNFLWRVGEKGNAVSAAVAGKLSVEDCPDGLSAHAKAIGVNI